MTITVESIWNQALDRVGYPRPVQFVYEGSRASVVLLHNYWQVRDALLERVRPDWAIADRVLTLLRSAPQEFTAPWSATLPPLGFAYEYAMPTDALDVISVGSGTPRYTPEWRPKPQSNFRLYSPPGGITTIASNTPDAVALCLLRVTAPDYWDSSFLELVIRGLAERIGPLLPQPPRSNGNANDANRRGEPSSQ